MNLNAKWHGIPIPLVIVGGSVLGFGTYRFVKQYRASKAAAQTQPSSIDGTTANPLPGWDQLAGMIGPLGGSSPTGPLLGYDSFGVPLYGLGPSTSNTSDSTKPADPAGVRSYLPVETGTPIDKAVASSLFNTAPAPVPAAAPAAPAPLPVYIAPSLPAAPSVYVAPNPIPGETGQVVTTNNNLPAGDTMTYGGSQQQITDIVNAVLNPTPVYSPPDYTPPSWGNLGGWGNYSW